MGSEKKGKKCKEIYLVSHPEKVKKLLTAIGNGYSHETCCRFAGISTSAFYSWLKKGRDDFEEGIESEYSKFFENSEKNNAIAEITLMGEIKDKGKNDWRSSAWILEHRFGYSKTVKVEDVTEKKVKTREEVEARIKFLQDKMKKG